MFQNELTHSMLTLVKQTSDYIFYIQLLIKKICLQTENATVLLVKISTMSIDFSLLN